MGVVVAISFPIMKASPVAPEHCLEREAAGKCGLVGTSRTVGQSPLLNLSTSPRFARIRCVSVYD